MKVVFNKIANFYSNSRMAGMREIVLVVLLTTVTITVILAILNTNRPYMLVLAGLLGTAIILTFQGRYTLASWGALTAGLVILSILIFRNNGIRDTAVMGLIVLLACAGLLAGKTGTLVIGSLIILEIGVIGALETNGVIFNQFSRNNFFSDYLTLSLLIGLVTVMQWIVISRLNANIQNAEKELHDRKDIEVQLRNAESRYRNLVEKIPLAIYISEPGDSGVWKYVSPQIEKMTGYPPSEWIENPRLWYSLIHPEDREDVVKAEIQALQGGNMPRMEYRLIQRDGRTIWLHDESMLSLDAEQNNLVQGFLLDITPRKMAEEQLQRRLAELQAVHGVSETLIKKTDLQKLIHETGEQIRKTFKANNVLIAIHDPATNSIHFPYDYEDGWKRKDKPIHYGEGMTTQIMERKKPLIIMENWQAVSAEYNAIYTNILPVMSSISVPIMTDEHVIGVITLESSEREHAFTDNDVQLLSTIAANLAVAVENTRLQESLKQELEIQEKLINELELKNQELERFTYTASHDLKSPLITIRGFLGYLEKDARAGNMERIQSDIKRISDATEKMHRLLSELLELSRIGRIVNEMQDVPFSEIVTEALRRVEGQMREKQVRVVVGSDFPTLQMDRERIIEVVQNLLDNAIKFTHGQTSPCVEINHKTENGKTVFYVKDNGIGISGQFHERIFGLFEKLDVDTEGTGVGLAIVKRIIEVHGGKIWVESEKGSGTTVFFTLGE